MYLQKYLKYKNKYLELLKKINQSGGKIQDTLYKNFLEYCKLLDEQHNPSNKWNFICVQFNKNMHSKKINIVARYIDSDNIVFIEATYSNKTTSGFIIDPFYFKDNGKQFIYAHYEPYLFHFLYQPIIFPFEDECFHGLFSTNDDKINDLKINICLAQILTDCGKHRCEMWIKDERRAFSHENCSIIEVINLFENKYHFSKDEKISKSVQEINTLLVEEQKLKNEEKTEEKNKPKLIKINELKNYLYYIL